MRFHTYKLVMKEELKANDYATLLNFAQKMKEELMNGGVLRKSLMISDKTRFYLCETVTNRTVVIMLVQMSSV